MCNDTGKLTFWMLPPQIVAFLAHFYFFLAINLINLTKIKALAMLKSIFTLLFDSKKKSRSKDPDDFRNRVRKYLDCNLDCRRV